MTITRCSALALVCAVAVAQGRDAPPREEPLVRTKPKVEVATPLREAFIECTPNSMRVNGADAVAANNPIAEALSKAGPGSVIQLAAGEYPAFAIGFDKQAPWNARISGGTPTQPIVVRAQGDVRVVPTSSGDTIAITQQFPCGYVTFEGLTIEAGYRAGVMFYKCGPSQVHAGFRFLDCSILGGFDHVRGDGKRSKWGVWGHSLKDFEFRGVSKPAVVRDLRNEHAFYLQNAKGDITIDRVNAARLGRTFVQFTARPTDGAPGVGTITVSNCVVEDACIAIGDDFKGGSAFTVAGRHTGTLIFRNNRYRSGFAPEIRRLTKPGVPFGTGAFVAWDGRGVPNGTLILENNDFAMAPGCGDRALVSIGGCRDVRIVGENRFVAGAASALEIDPSSAPGFASNVNGAVRLDKSTRIEGALRVDGALATAEVLDALAATRRAVREGDGEKH